MDDETVDLRGERQRLARLGVAIVIAVSLTVAAMWTMDSVSGAPDTDPVGASARPVLAIVIFIVSTAWVTLLLARLQERGRS